MSTGWTSELLQSPPALMLVIGILGVLLKLLFESWPALLQRFGGKSGGSAETGRNPSRATAVPAVGADCGPTLSAFGQVLNAKGAERVALTKALPVMPFDPKSEPDQKQLSGIIMCRKRLSADAKAMLLYPASHPRHPGQCGYEPLYLVVASVLAGRLHNVAMENKFPFVSLLQRGTTKILFQQWQVTKDCPCALFVPLHQLLDVVSHAALLDMELPRLGMPIDVRALIGDLYDATVSVAGNNFPDDVTDKTLSKHRQPFDRGLKKFCPLSIYLSSVIVSSAADKFTGEGVVQSNVLLLHNGLLLRYSRKDIPAIVSGLETLDYWAQHLKGSIIRSKCRRIGDAVLDHVPQVKGGLSALKTFVVESKAVEGTPWITEMTPGVKV